MIHGVNFLERQQKALKKNQIMVGVRPGKKYLDITFSALPSVR
jgi:hypothetical protein